MFKALRNSLSMPFSGPRPAVSATMNAPRHPKKPSKEAKIAITAIAPSTAPFKPAIATLTAVISKQSTTASVMSGRTS